MDDFRSAKFLLLEAIARLELAARPRTPPPSPPRSWNPDDGSPTFEVSYRESARSRSPSPMVAPVARTPPPIHQMVRRRRGFCEAYPSPLARLPPIVNHSVVRTGEPNPKYERVGEFLVLRK